VVPSEMSRLSARPIRERRGSKILGRIEKNPSRSCGFINAKKVETDRSAQQYIAFQGTVLFMHTC